MDERPSGSYVRVVKTFRKEEDYRFQKGFHLDNPGLLLPIEDEGAHSYGMPIGRALRTPAEVASLFELYNRLWALPPMRACNRIDYQGYVRRQSHVVSAPLLKALDHLWVWGEMENRPIEESARVHGDATLENAVIFNNTTYLIDPSPRAAPPERLVDLTKLAFCWTDVLESFWTSDVVYAVAKHVVTAAPGHFCIKDSSLEINSPLAAYHYVAHLVRVNLRDPKRAPRLERALSLVPDRLLKTPYARVS